VQTNQTVNSRVAPDEPFGAKKMRAMAKTGRCMDTYAAYTALVGAVQYFESVAQSVWDDPDAALKRFAAVAARQPPVSIAALQNEFCGEHAIMHAALHALAGYARALVGWQEMAQRNRCMGQRDADQQRVQRRTDAVHALLVELVDIRRNAAAAAADSSVGSGADSNAVDEEAAAEPKQQPHQGIGDDGGHARADECDEPLQVDVEFLLVRAQHVVDGDGHEGDDGGGDGVEDEGVDQVGGLEALEQGELPAHEDDGALVNLPQKKRAAPRFDMCVRRLF
jgi:hypothetical protein